MRRGRGRVGGGGEVVEVEEGRWKRWRRREIRGKKTETKQDVDGGVTEGKKVSTK